ncbi:MULTISPECIES: MIP/aquaporin family protein [Robiginitalea]|uniref:Putative glycerol diffusion channel n=1 Tax=Robiginitalea biformata (strain ATCC BAA-864 / DSM 15991 / KCTC 12146 / HTCC2501) TaxID=313596 RepID=A4CJ46_ROBBH|nr:MULTISPECIES: MIP/aquaporin family protein [Robiginitalea]EAR16954.1 putative glycerol diffusion channel [Robiginitalea biformata HTCC2501]MDC6352842.1 aquaporin family protein [Robiginitalea sp. PM2]MDC6373992.1 aquaporin family protein [Robiginitalea sp. SP8]
MTPFTAEFIGTFLLILLGCGVVANVVLEGTKGNGGGWMVITTGWAFAVFVGVVVASPYSGAHINPAVTVGLAAAGEFPWEDVPPYLLAQLLGAMLGAFLVWVMHKDHFAQTADSSLKLAVFSTEPAIMNKPINLLCEAVGTFVLVFTVLYFTDASLSEPETVIGLGSLGALPVALLVWGIGLSLGGTTGYAINPARDLGPRIIHSLVPIRNRRTDHWGYSWVPILGPLLGGLLAAAAYLVLA